MTTPGVPSGYAEIGITTNFSFLRGGSHPQEYVHQASEFDLPAIGIADHNTLAGVVRAYSELENPELKHKPKFLIGSRLVFTDDTPDILVYPRDREAYGRLCQLLTRGKRAAEKGECHLKLDDLCEFAEGQLMVLTLPHRFEAAKALSQRLSEDSEAPVRMAYPTWMELHATIGRPPAVAMRVLPDGSRMTGDGRETQ